jgi:hypothetical protein
VLNTYEQVVCAGIVANADEATTVATRAALTTALVNLFIIDIFLMLLIISFYTYVID